MSRRRKLVAVALTVTTVAVAGAAYAAFSGRLRGTVNATKLSIAWQTATVASNDAGTALDPSAGGMAPIRQAQHIGSMEVASATTGLITLTATGLYDSYRASVTGDATITGGGSAVFKVQSVTLTGVPVGTVITPRLHPGVCGLILSSTPQTVTFDVEFVDIAAAPATFSIGVDVNIVAGAAYSPAGCVSF